MLSTLALVCGTHTSPTQLTGTTCNDACTSHGDGNCDDGGYGSEFSFCQFGSDCTDCDPRVLSPPTGYAFASRTALKSGVAMWTTNRVQAVMTYGYINTWDTSQVTDMNHLFSGYCNTFNDDIADWDTSRVTHMGDMFDECYAFDQVRARRLAALLPLLA